MAKAAKVAPAPEYGSSIVAIENEPHLTAADFGGTSYLVGGTQEYGPTFLDACNAAVLVHEQLSLGRRDQGGNVTERQTFGQIIPRVLYETLRRFDGKASDWPISREPVPETTYEPTDSPRDQAYLVLLDLLDQCRWSRSTHMELILADNRAYMKANAAERALDRLETIFGSLLQAHRLAPDAEVMELRDRVRALTELVEQARDRGFVPTGKAG